MSVRRSLYWSVGGQVLSFIVGFGGAMATARLLAPWEIGLNAIAVATMQIAQIVATFGISSYVIRDKELAPQTLDLAFTVNAILMGGLALTLLALSFAGDLLLGDSRAGHILRLLAIAQLVGIFGFRAWTMLQRDMLFRPFAIISTITVATNALTTVALAASGFSYLSAALAGIVSACVSAILLNAAAPHHFALRTELRGWRDIARFGIDVMSVGGVTVLGARLSEIILGRILGIAALGIYSRAAVINNLMFENLYGSVTRVVFSNLSKSLRETGQLRAPFMHAFELILSVMWPIQIGLAILAPPVIQLLFGAKWIDSALPLSLLMIAQAIVLSFGMNWELFVLRGETRVQRRLEIWRALTGLLAFSAGTQFGMAGAASGRIVEAGMGAILYRGHIDRMAQIARGEANRILGRAALLAIAATAPSLALMIGYRWSSDTPLWSVAAALLAGIVLWGVALRMMRHPLLHELQRLVGPLRDRHQ